MKNCYLFLATGFEEIEATTTIDILRRAGLNLITVYLSYRAEQSDSASSIFSTTYS